MLVWVEQVARLRVDFADLGVFKRFLQFVEGHLHAHFQCLEIAALVLQRHFQIVFYRQHFGGEFLPGKFVCRLQFFLMAAAQILLGSSAAQLL